MPLSLAARRPPMTALLSSRLGGAKCLLIFLLPLLANEPGAAFGSTRHAPSDDHKVCEAWATIAARDHGVPELLMLAIAYVETGRDIQGQPTTWPWSVNSAGRGARLASREAAVMYARHELAAATSALDVGCFQLNVQWHGRAFSSLDQMIDPAKNAAYAARFLAALRAELGTWRAAAAAYHSRTPSLGKAYLSRLDHTLDRLSQAPRLVESNLPGGNARARRASAPLQLGPQSVDPLFAPTSAAAKRPEEFAAPADERGSLGSLVPLGEPAAATALAPIGLE